MALYTGKNTLKPDSRSRIGALQIGEHESPSEDWLVDPTLTVVLKNPYGGPGFEDVLVPMGRIVAVGDPIQAYTGKMKNTLTIADLGTAAKSKVVGVAPYNFTKDGNYASGSTNPVNDRFGGNKPAIITNKYIRLPYIPTKTESDLCPWGHVWGSAIKSGDKVRCVNVGVDGVQAGLFTKWVSGVDDPDTIVGQIYAQDFNQESMGWIKMAMWEEMAKYDDEIWQNYYKLVYQAKGDSSLQPWDGVPYSSAYHAATGTGQTVGAGLMDMAQYGYFSQYQQKFYGIPGLTDGANRALTRFTGQSLKRLTVGGVVSELYPFTVFPTPTAAGTAYTFQISDQAGGKLIDIVNSTDVAKKLVVKVNNIAITEGTGNGQYQINYKTGVLTYKASAAGADAGLAITVDFCTTYFGTPSYLDFKGVVGVFNILLKL